MSDDASPISARELEQAIVAYLKTSVLHGDPDDELTELTPILRYGILNSIRTAALISHIELELRLPLDDIEFGPETLQDVRTLASAILR